MIYYTGTDDWRSPHRKGPDKLSLAFMLLDNLNSPKIDLSRNEQAVGTLNASRVWIKYTLGRFNVSS